MSVDLLFEEFLSRWTGDEPVDTEGLLERAGPGAGELAGLIDAFLARAPRRGSSAEASRAIAALAARLEAEPPLLTARVGARRRVGDLARAIVEACGLPAEAEGLVGSYYQRLEGGLLDPRGVSARVWAVLDRLVAPAARSLALEAYWIEPVPPGAPAAAFHRAASPGFPAAPPPPVGAPPAAAPPPEDDFERRVDELFTRGEAS